jgi:hypothetical protein
MISLSNCQHRKYRGELVRSNWHESSRHIDAPNPSLNRAEAIGTPKSLPSELLSLAEVVQL